METLRISVRNEYTELQITSRDGYVFSKENHLILPISSDIIWSEASKAAAS